MVVASSDQARLDGWMDGHLHTTEYSSSFASNFLPAINISHHISWMLVFGQMPLLRMSRHVSTRSSITSVTGLYLALINEKYLVSLHTPPYYYLICDSRCIVPCQVLVCFWLDSFAQLSDWANLPSPYASFPPTSVKAKSPTCRPSDA